MAAINTLAGAYAAMFEQAERTSGDKYYRVRDAVPEADRERAQALIRDAHESEYGLMLPDDWRYALIVEALQAIAGHDTQTRSALDELPDEIADESTDHYNATLVAWVGSHSYRFNGYADQALDEYGDAISGGFMGLVQRAQYAERREVCGRVLDALYAEIEADGGEPLDDAA